MHTKVGNLSELGSRLREERKRRGLNQHDMAVLGGVTRNSQADYEGGKSAAGAAYFMALAAAEIDVGYVMTGDRSTPKDDRPEELSLVTMRVAMPPREALAEMFEGLLAIWPDLRGGELAQELARHLPTALAQLTDLRMIPDGQRANAREAAEDRRGDRREPRPARRT